MHERLSLSADGRKVLYKLKRRYRDGSTLVVLDPITLIERPAALVPRPRVHLTIYHGVFAPAATLRDRVVLAPDAPEAVVECSHTTTSANDPSDSPPVAPARPPPQPSLHFP
ncbi:MAG: transposase [Planctomycetota bacterium]